MAFRKVPVALRGASEWPIGALFGPSTVFRSLSCNRYLSVIACVTNARGGGRPELFSSRLHMQDAVTVI